MPGANSDPFWYIPWRLHNHENPVVSLLVWWYEMFTSMPSMPHSLLVRSHNLMLKVGRTGFDPQLVERVGYIEVCHFE
jgi:hypothetical protein